MVEPGGQGTTAPMTRQSEDSFARPLLDEVGATQTLRALIEGYIGEALRASRSSLNTDCGSSQL